MSEMNRTILVAGVTGKQGGAVARHLIDRGFAAVRGITRKPDSKQAMDLADLGVQIVQADLDDAASLERALQGVWGVFSVQAITEGGVEKEVQEGKRLAQMARDAGVEHFVYSSVGSANRQTGIPHFDSKWQIEQTVRFLGFPTCTILRPVFFMENLLMALQGDNLVLPLSPMVVMQMIAVDDIGRFGALAFEKPMEMNGAEIDIAGDAATMPQAAETLSEAFGRKITFSRMPIDQMRSRSAEMAVMFEWFERVGYSVDIAGLERKYSIECMKLTEWARQHAAVR